MADPGAGDPAGGTAGTTGSTVGSTTKGEQRRAQIARAATDLVRAQGPAALSHRAVAQRAGVSLSATTYYYGGLDDVAGSGLVDAWVAHAEQVLAGVPGSTGPADPAAVLTEALLPPGDDEAVLAHYQLLLDAGRTPALAAALAEGRQRLDAVLAALLRALHVRAVPPALVLAVLDGAVVTAVSEARPLRPTTRTLLHALLP
jgi:DNA-binding transcriptional regulator YbjK